MLMLQDIIEMCRHSICVLDVTVDMMSINAKGCSPGDLPATTQKRLISELLMDNLELEELVELGQEVPGHELEEVLVALEVHFVVVLELAAQVDLVLAVLL